MSGHPGLGDTVTVVGEDGAFLCRAAFSPHSQIRARAWTFDSTEAIDAGFFERRVARAIDARRELLDAGHTACRLIHAESDGLPGVVADLYGDVVVVQLTSAGAERWRDVLVEAIGRATRARCIYERSDAEVRALEGLPPRSGPLLGDAPTDVEIFEHGLRFGVDVREGQKTGFFLDQRDSRAAVTTLASGRAVLNMFCYTGAFSLAALAGGAASVLSVDSSAEAIDRARDNLALNPTLDDGRSEWRVADAFAELRQLRDKDARFDLIVLDPPKFAPTAQHAPRAARAYKDINLWGLRLLRPGGLLATFSCSGGIDAALFRKIVAGAAVDAAVDATVVRTFTASADHPVALAFPEGEYLKGLLLRRTA